MNQQTQDDLKLFKKAKRRINAMLVFSYLLLGLWNGATYFLLTQPLFERPHSFLIFYLTSMLAQMIVWMMIFFALSEGKPKLRILLILGILAQIGWCVFLGYDLVQNSSFIVFYVLWIAMELIQVFYLLWVRGWLKNSWWARIFFDHVVELEGQEEEPLFQTQPVYYEPNNHQTYPQEYVQQTIQQIPQEDLNEPEYQEYYDEQPAPVTPASSFAGTPDIVLEESQRMEPEESAPSKKFPFFSKRDPIQETQFSGQGPIDFQSNAQIEALRQLEAARRQAHEVSQAYAHMALRMALVVYGELILFPILINIFQNNFVSIDNSSVFAINLMFTLCILSAVVWTLPIFFLYLKQPGVKKILWGAAVLQIAVAAFGLWMLHGYYTSQTIHYADKVFTYFLMAEVVRYGLLIAGILPAFQLPSIQESYLEEAEEDDPNIVLELVAEDDPEENENDEDEEMEDIKEIPLESLQKGPESKASFLEIDDIKSDTK